MVRIFIICIIASITGLLLSGCNRDRQVEKMLQKAVAELNKQLPMQIDDATIADSCKALPNKTICHYYTIIIPIEPNAFPVFKEYMLLTTAKTINLNKYLVTLKKENVTFKYVYYDTEGNFLFDIALIPEYYNAYTDDDSDEAIYKGLKNLVDAYQYELPILFDDAVSVTKIDVQYPKTIDYVVECPAFVTDSKFDTVQFKEERIGFMTEEARNNIFSSVYRDGNITFRYIYFGENKKYLCTLIIAPDNQKEF